MTKEREERYINLSKHFNSLSQDPILGRISTEEEANRLFAPNNFGYTFEEVYSYLGYELDEN